MDTETDRRPDPDAPAPTAGRAIGVPGALAAEARRMPYLSPDEERALARRAIAGDGGAADLLIVSHLRVVVNIARRYVRFGMPINDLIQEGTIGLIQAVQRFNPDRETRLSTYAMWWIRAAIQDYVVRSWSLVRVGKTAAHRALFFHLRALAALGRDDGVAAPAAAGDDDVLGRLAARFGLPLAEVAAFARRVAGTDQALDVPAAPGADQTLLDRLPAGQPDPEEEAVAGAMARLWAQLVDRALAMLPAREALIIRERHLTEAVRTFESIGRDLGLSKDRVRQLEKQALARLRERLLPLVADHGLP